MPVALEYYSDHMVVRLVGPAMLSSLRRRIVVPYSSIEDATAGVPRWPSPFDFRVGTHLPMFIASGSFRRLPWGRKRFVHYERTSKRVLTIHLAGDVGYDEVSIQVGKPDEARDEIRRRARRAR